MRKAIFIFILSVSLSSCSKTFIQVFDTSALNSQLRGDFFVYETDTLRITYSFWASKGIMSFAVYNKLEKPIYIDWKNSAFIYNDNKLNYWIEETQTNTSSYYGGYFYNGPLVKPGVTVNEGIQKTSSSTIKPEKITFIPPKSNYFRSQFYLLPVNYFKLNLKSKATITRRNDKPKKKTTIYSEDFSLDNTPLRFRNFLSIAFAENSQQFFFVENGFYLTSVKEMDYRHYRGKLLGNDDNGNFLYERPFSKQTSFYIKIDSEKSVESRK